MVNIRRVAETHMVSVRKRNIQGRYNSVRHLQRRYLELPPLVLFQLLQVQFRYRSKIPNHPEQESGDTPKSKIFAPR